ncbi:hypothetical protein V8G54_032836 [Vigna mungo]|uniref:Disease resistance protein At4g27190-like leucine-rich repeats domain-containing protein n=1 Tax=Vigna mungo TaxID=3915 RepID=A0AAQ3RIA6_VIGMU
MFLFPGWKRRGVWKHNTERLLQRKFGFNEEAAVNIVELHSKLLFAKEETIVIENPEANQLLFESLPSLRKYSSGDIIEWPSLKKVTVNDCPNIIKFGFGRTKSLTLENQASLTDIFESWDDEFSTIVEYEIGDTQELHKRMHNLRPSHFTNLVVFRAKNCDEKLTEFIYILMKRSKKLRVIEIQHCKTSRYLFEILDHTYKDKKLKYLRGVKELKVIEVNQMVSLCNWFDANYLDFKSLEIVHLKCCHSIQVLFYEKSFSSRLSELKELKLEACEDLEQVVYSSVSFPRLSKVELKSLSKFMRFSEIHGNFYSLKTLIIEECPCLEEFTINQAILVHFDGPTNNNLPELDELRLDGCDVLLYVASFETPPEKMELKKLFVSNCYALKMVIMVKEIPNSIELLPQLDELILINLPNLTHIIDKECVRLYQNLHTLQVDRCGFLHWLPIPLTLINMKILDCDSLQKTVVIREEKEEKEKVIFSQLREVTLQNLRNLYTAFPSGSEFPSLEILKITNCPSLMTFVEESNELKEHKEQTISRCFFPNSLSLEKLKVLHIIDQDIKELWHYCLSSESFCISGGFTKTAGISRGFAKIVSISGGFIKTVGISDSFAKTAGISGGFAKTADISGRFAKTVVVV